MKTLVITGGSSGIGAATADLFASRGYRVFELSRSGKDREGVKHIGCDVTSESSCLEAIAAVLKETERIDVAISNAGFGISGAIEFTTTEEAKKQMDVNFFGALNFTKAVLPQLRKQLGGRILYTSSVAAVLPVPYQSFYSASKAAINAMALSLQNEVRPFGIKVACVLPGDVRSNFVREKSVGGEDVYTRAEHAVQVMEKDEQNGISSKEIARIYWRMAESRCPRPFYVGGGMYKFYCFLQWLLPTRLSNWIEGRMYR